MLRSLQRPLHLLLLLSLSCATVRHPARDPDGTLARISEWEQRRSLGGGELARWATQHPDPAVRARSLLAMGRIQSASSVPAIAQALTDAEPGVRREAAFAAGLLGLSWTPLSEPTTSSLVEAVLTAEAHEKDGVAALRMIEALGRIASPRSTERLVQRLEHPSLHAKAALALGAAAKRGGAPVKTAVPALLAMARSADPGDRYAGAYALALSKLPEGVDALAVCLSDSEAEVRAICAKGLGDVGGDAQAALLGQRMQDGDPRVVAEAARSLSRMAGKCAGTGPCAALENLELLIPRTQNTLAVLAVAQQGLPAAGKSLLERLRQALNEGAPKPSRRGDLAKLDCRLAAALDRLKGTLEQTLTCGGGQVPEPVRLMLGLHELAQAAPAPGRVQAVAPYLARPEPELQTAALGVLGELKDPAAVPLLRPYLHSADVSFVGSAVGALTPLKDPGLEKELKALALRVPSTPDLAAPVADAIVELKAQSLEPLLRGWLSSPDAQTRHVAAAALTKLTGARVQVPDVERLATGVTPMSSRREAKVRFHTPKGNIDVRLDLDEAPRTSENFLQLTAQKYYRNLTFHRVVPDFVAQAGASRLDGDSSPGYTIPCEITHGTYARGAMGMALSGKDTGSTQFFFTTSAQPHLDGRYTRFGEVIAGMQVVDSLLEGDLIVDAEILP